MYPDFSNNGEDYTPPQAAQPSHHPCPDSTCTSSPLLSRHPQKTVSPRYLNSFTSSNLPLFTLAPWSSYPSELLNLITLFFSTFIFSFLLLQLLPLSVIHNQQQTYFIWVTLRPITLNLALFQLHPRRWNHKEITYPVSYPPVNWKVHFFFGYSFEVLLLFS